MNSQTPRINAFAPGPSLARPAESFLFLLWINTLGRSRVAKFIWSGIGILLIYILGVFVREQYGIAIVIRNASGQPLRQLRIQNEPRGRGYDLRDLAPQKKVRVFVKPREESHLNLEYTDIVGVRHSELVVGYIEGGYCGKAEVNVLSRYKVTSDEKIDPVACIGGWFDFI